MSSRLRVLADHELAAVIQAVEEPRELALVSLLSSTGLRMVEVPRLEVDGLVRRRDSSALLYVPPGIVHLGRLVHVPEQALAHLDAYLAGRRGPTAESEPLFLGDEGQALSSAETGLIVLRAIARAGIDAQAFVRVKGTGLRIADVLSLTFASRYLRSGGEIEGLRRSLGHRDLHDTEQLVGRLLPAGQAIAVPAT